jgi:hypothetical protein
MAAIRRSPSIGCEMGRLRPDGHARLAYERLSNRQTAGRRNRRSVGAAEKLDAAHRPAPHQQVAMTTSPDQPPPDALETRLRAELAELMAVGAEVLHTLTREPAVSVT